MKTQARPTSKALAALVLGALLSFEAAAQFTGPSVPGKPGTVAQVVRARLGTYVAVTGHIVAHQRQNYFTFRDGTGEIRVEIEESVWQGRKVGPETKVRLLAEIDQGPAGRYLWVKSLQLVD